jgi:hypothetical protein
MEFPELANKEIFFFVLDPEQVGQGGVWVDSLKRSIFSNDWPQSTQTYS